MYLPNQHILLENIIKQLPRPFVITGNFNSHNIRWESQKNYSRSKEIEKLLENENLV